MGWTLDDYYDEYPRIEAEFEEFLDESLDPRGPDLLYDLVAGLGLPAGSRVLDIGCGEGAHSIRLARDFGFQVLGIDPVGRHLDLARAAAAAEPVSTAAEPVEVRFAAGGAEAIPAPDGGYDLVWCRDVLIHVPDLPRAFAEIHRVLRPGGHAITYTMLVPDPAGLSFLDDMGVVAGSADPAAMEAAIAGSGLSIVDVIEIGSEWSERAQEQSGKPGRKLLHAARLLRDPDRYIDRFGRFAYQVMLGDCLWHVYAMIGRLHRRAYVLRRGSA